MPELSKTDFDFGKNWASYTDKVIDEKRIDAAVDSLKMLLAGESLGQRSFLDVGCGTGMFSAAAARLGASPVMGIDVNPLCIEVSRRNHKVYAAQAAASFEVISALDAPRMARLDTFDAVYAWGSLHHSGKMWEAITNTAGRVKTGGTFILAIYHRHWTSGTWKGIKLVYNLSPKWLKPVWTAIFYPLIYLAKLAITRENPLKMHRGMDFYHDVIDWIGGYPYEYASIDEMKSFVEKLGFKMIRVFPAAVPTGNNQFIFKKCA
jgi:SAM-dependent methyltransferase